MSVQALSWVLEDAPIPNPTPDGMPPSHSLALVLLGLANHASRTGKNAFPSVKTLGKYSRLGERQVQRALNALAELGLITVGNQAIATAEIGRKDRAPVVYDLSMNLKRGDSQDTPSERGDISGTGRHFDTHGVTESDPRGDISPLHGVTPKSPEPRDKPGKDKPRENQAFSASVSGAAAPPSLCLKHMNEPSSGNCVSCGDARRARKEWDERQEATRRGIAAIRRGAIDQCVLCDENGIRHIPTELIEFDLPAMRCDHFELIPSEWPGYPHEEAP